MTTNLLYGAQPFERFGRLEIKLISQDIGGDQEIVEAIKLASWMLFLARKKGGLCMYLQNFSSTFCALIHNLGDFSLVGRAPLVFLHGMCLTVYY